MTSAKKEILCSRKFNFAQALVFQAWSNPNYLKNWWGPAGFTNTFNEFDFREGGRWRFVMHGPDKGNYPNECEFTKIDGPRLIAWKRHSKPLFRVVATFERINASQTSVIFKMIFETASACNKIKRFAIAKNEENFDKLENELIKISSSGYL